MPTKNGFEFQGRDAELLHLVHQLGIATTEHLARHFGRDTHTI